MNPFPGRVSLVSKKMTVRANAVLLPRLRNMATMVLRPPNKIRMLSGWTCKPEQFSLAKNGILVPKAGRKEVGGSQYSWIGLRRSSVGLQPGSKFGNLRVGPTFCASAGTVDVEKSVADEGGLTVPPPRLTLKELCEERVPQHILEKAEELGFKYPTVAQQEALPVLLSGSDCLLHAQTGSGKTLAYLLPILAKLVPRAAVQAIIVVPTRELGMQVAKVARTLMGKSLKSSDSNSEEKVSGKGEGKGTLTVMTLLDGGSANRQKKWIKAAPPQLIVGTLRCLSKLIESNHLRCNSVTTVVIDEVDTLLGSAKEGNHLQGLLAVHTRATDRQTIFASATVPQHNRFLHDCIQNKWAKNDIVHVHVTPEVMMPRYLQHRYVVCDKQDKLDTLVALLNADNPRAAILFVNDQNDKARRNGNPPPTSVVAEFLSESLRLGVLGKTLEGSKDLWEPLILEEDDHINQRVSTLSEFREGRCLLVATDIAARGLDLPEVSHVYNIDLPPNVTSYIHRAGRTGRRPIEEEQGIVTSFIISKELFVLRRIENESQTRITPLHIVVDGAVE
ncbi:hypothetical protein R1flu_015785 [Riccia fluitans]|uniref:RNA helicase n=1 Tax=Riccia fluitans TaxID=41844 RepID=A0ABD1YJZ2_9MARC